MADNSLDSLEKTLRPLPCYGRKWNPLSAQCKECPGIVITGDQQGPERCVSKLVQETLWRMNTDDSEEQAQRLHLPEWLIEKAKELVLGGKTRPYPYLTQRHDGKPSKKIPGWTGRRWRKERMRRPTIRQIPIGTTLVRTYKGVDYRVTNCKGYWEMDGERYGTLTEVAKAITGHKWPGASFFGMYQ